MVTMDKYPEDMDKDELQEFCEELELIGKTEKCISFDEMIFREHMKELGGQK